MQAIGKIIAEKRKSKAMSQEDLAILLDCTQQFISKVERDKSGLSKIYQIKFSKIFDFDFVTLCNNLEHYRSLEHYLLSRELIIAIEEENRSKIKEILKDELLISEFNYGRPLILKLYSKAVIALENKENERVFKFTLAVFEKDSILEMEDFKLETSQEYRYYSTILVLSIALEKTGHKALALKVLKNTIDFLEASYFNVLAISSIEYFFKKFYIAVLNNYSDLLFILGENNLALETCDKAIKFAIKNKILYTLDFLFYLKIEILYYLDRINEAKNLRNQLIAFCELTDNFSLIEELDLLIKEKYPLLF